MEDGYTKLLKYTVKEAMQTCCAWDVQQGEQESFDVDCLSPEMLRHFAEKVSISIVGELRLRGTLFTAGHTGQ